MTRIFFVYYVKFALSSHDLIVRASLFNARFNFHLCLQIILPLVGSYGETSISTVSPGKILMYLILIFPDTWAKIIMYKRRKYNDELGQRI